MAFPTIYIDTGGTALGSGSTDTTNPTHSSTINSVTVAVAGTTVSFNGAINISAVPNDGSATIFINDATNTNQKIFKITAVDDTLDTVTVSVAPTGTIATSTWGIGGQFVYDSARFEAALAAGWTAIINNSPAAKSADFFTQRAAGDSASGNITLKGKTGVRPVLNITNTTQCIQGAANSHYWKFENLELDQDGASGSVFDSTASSSNHIFNIKISDGGGTGIAVANAHISILGCEIGGVDGSGIASGSSLRPCFGNYIHDVGIHGILDSATNQTMYVGFNIIDTCADRGIYKSGAVSANLALANHIYNNTIYGCGNSGLEVTDADADGFLLINNIFQDNGNAAGEFNVLWVAGSAEISGIHYNNLFYHQGGGGGANLSGLTANSTEVTTDPLFANAASGNFTLNAQSPALATAYPGTFLGGSIGYLDMGAVQRKARRAALFTLGI